MQPSGNGDGTRKVGQTESYAYYGCEYPLIGFYSNSQVWMQSAALLSIYAGSRFSIALDLKTSQTSTCLYILSIL